MDAVTVSITFLHNFMAGFLMPWLGLLLINVKPVMRKLCLTALVYAFAGVLFRNIINLSYDISFMLQVFVLVVSIMIIFRISVFQATIAAVMGTIVMALGEVVTTIALINRFGPALINSNDILILVLLPLPQILITLFIIYLCTRLDFHLFNLTGTKQESISSLQSKRLKTVTILVLILLIVIFVQLAFNMFVINQEYNMFRAVPLPMIGVFSTAILIMGVISMAFLIKQLVELTEKESQYHIQTLYINTLDELYTAIRSERHDIINHLQTVYGFIQLNYIHEARDYLNELLGGNILSNEFIITGSPGLTALFYIKSGLAKTNQIDFHVNVKKQIDDLMISPYELNNILGNLINNAFDEVKPVENKRRTVIVDIEADDNNYIFTVSNNGFIDEVSKPKLFHKGFSTKNGEHSGLGLYICNRLVKKYGGHIEVNNNTDQHTVEISVFLPVTQRKGAWNESIGQETGACTG